MQRRPQIDDVALLLAARGSSRSHIDSDIDFRGRRSIGRVGKWFADVAAHVAMVVAESSVVQSRLIVEQRRWAASLSRNCCVAGDEKVQVCRWKVAVPGRRGIGRQSSREPAAVGRYFDWKQVYGHVHDDLRSLLFEIHASGRQTRQALNLNNDIYLLWLQRR